MKCIVAVLITALVFGMARATCITDFAKSNNYCCEPPCNGMAYSSIAMCKYFLGAAGPIIELGLSMVQRTCTSSYKLSVAIKEAFDCVFPRSILDSVIVYEGCRLTDNYKMIDEWWLKYEFDMKGIEAQVYGDEIYFSKNAATDIESLLQTLSHELVHVWQYRKLGSKARFADQYARHWCNWGAYHRIPLEIEAEKISNHFKQRGSCPREKPKVCIEFTQDRHTGITQTMFLSNSYPGQLVDKRCSDATTYWYDPLYKRLQSTSDSSKFLTICIYNSQGLLIIPPVNDYTAFGILCLHPASAATPVQWHTQDYNIVQFGGIRRVLRAWDLRRYTNNNYFRHETGMVRMRQMQHYSSPVLSIDAYYGSTVKIHYLTRGSTRCSGLCLTDTGSSADTWSQAITYTQPQSSHKGGLIAGFFRAQGTVFEVRANGDICNWGTTTCLLSYKSVTIRDVTALPSGYNQIPKCAEWCPFRQGNFKVGSNIFYLNGNGQLCNWGSLQCMQNYGGSQVTTAQSMPPQADRDMLNFCQKDCAPTSRPTIPLTTKQPTRFPTTTTSPTKGFPSVPTTAPTQSPSRAPSRTPSLSPSQAPSRTPSLSPSRIPSRSPSRTPSMAPSRTPSLSPSGPTSRSPSRAPSTSPSKSPSRSATLGLSISVAPTSSSTTIGAGVKAWLMLSLVAASVLFLL